MEGSSVGPTNSHSRPIRNASRYFYGHHNSASAANFTGPVRRWEKKWVHVSQSQPSNKPRKHFLSNVSKSSNSPILLCKWTPLSRPNNENTTATATATATTTAVDDVSGGGGLKTEQFSRRRFRYTPITVFEQKKKLTAKEVADGHKSGADNQSKERSDMDNDDIYGLPDINSDFMEPQQRTNEGDLIYSRRSQLNGGYGGLHLDSKNKDGQSDQNVKRFWAMN